jgi:hypothetical protein
MEMAKFQAVIRARFGDEIMAEIVLLKGVNRLTIEQYIEQSDHYASARMAKQFLKDFFMDSAIVTIEMKIL